jgi:hypothetical protein
LIVNVSLIIGILIPGIMFRNYSTDSPTQEGRDLAFKLMLTEAIMCYICLVPNMVLQKDKPPTAASESSDMVR